MFSWFPEISLVYYFKDKNHISASQHFEQDFRKCVIWNYRLKRKLFLNKTLFTWLYDIISNQGWDGARLLYG